jgi:hypothetical protein
MKHPTSFRVSEQARQLLSKMAEDTSISQTAMLEILIREGAKKRGVRADARLQAESQQEPTSRD